MKLVLYILGGFSTLVLWVFLITPDRLFSGHPAIFAATFVLFSVVPFGQFWMMYMATRYERNPFPLFLLSFFVPFAFLWYYFERVRPGKVGRVPHFVSEPFQRNSAGLKRPGSPLISDPDVARQISDTMTAMFEHLSDSCDEVKQKCSEEEYAAYNTATSRIAGAIVFDVLEPLYDEHPNLKPANWDDPERGNEELG